MSEKVQVGNIVEGKVLRIKPFGAIVSLGDKMQGLVHISQIANNFVQDINEHIAVGDIVKVKVLSVDEASNKISLSIREALPSATKTSKPSNFEKKFRSKEHKSNYENRTIRPADDYFKPQSSPSDFEDKMKDWLKQSNERQAGLNKRANKRS